MATYRADQLDARNIGSILNFTDSEGVEVFGRLEMIERHPQGFVSLTIEGDDEPFELPNHVIVVTQRSSADSQILHLRSAIESLTSSLAAALEQRPMLHAV